MCYVPRFEVPNYWKSDPRNDESFVGAFKLSKEKGWSSSKGCALIRNFGSNLYEARVMRGSLPPRCHVSDFRAVLEKVGLEKGPCVEKMAKSY